MNSRPEPLSKSYIAYQFFKYLIYSILCYDLYLFYVDDLLASTQTFSQGVELSEIVLAFSATIDSSAWILLLLVFELETFVISDENIKGATKWAIFATKSICYFFIFYACYGYIDKLLGLLDHMNYQIADVCSLIGTKFTYIVTLDEYVPISENICQAMNSETLLRINFTEIISTQSNLFETQKLAWIDIINAVDWLFIVAILEIDVYLQLRGRLTGRARRLSQILKPILYLILFINATYWGFNGNSVDFWDAFLWLVAFFFIEMNIFEWHAESQENKDESDGNKTTS